MKRIIERRDGHDKNVWYEPCGMAEMQGQVGVANRRQAIDYTNHREGREKDEKK